MLTPETIASLLDGSPHDRNQLARELIPMVERHVFYTLRAAGRSFDRLDDYTQETLASLFKDDGRRLRDWRPERASLGGYLGMIVGRYVRRQLSRPSSSSQRVGLEADDLAGGYDHQDVELAYRAALEQIRDWLMDECTDKDRQRFEAIFVQQRSVHEVAEEEGTTVDALYTWISRFKKRVKEAFPHLWELLGWHDDDADSGSKGST